MLCLNCFRNKKVDRRRQRKVVYFPSERRWTWKPVSRRGSKRKSILPEKGGKMSEHRRSEAILRNLAEELLTGDECHLFKQALHHFRVSHSVTTLCQELKPIINTTTKILLLVELSTRLPKKLQEDFHRLCGLQFSNYDAYLKIFTNGNSSNEMPRVIAQDSSGKFKIISRGSEKKMVMRYNNQRQAYELQSVPGTSVTSGVYSNASDSDDGDDDVFYHTDTKVSHGRVTPVHLKGKTNIHKVMLNRHEDGSLGLGINGGKEYGTEIIISVVEEGGPAASQGLQVGDKILDVNGHHFQGMTHAEAVLVMRNAWNLIMHVERQSNDTGSKTDVRDHGPRRQVQELELVVFPPSSGRLGCITQRLNNQDLVVMAVEENSPASKAGLEAEDQILKVDGINVRELSEKQIVMLTHAKKLILFIRRTVILNSVDGIDGANIRKTMLTPDSVHKTRGGRSRSGSQRGRDNSEESRHSQHSTHLTREISVPVGSTSPLNGQRFTSKQGYYIYSSKPSDKANWVLSPKPREHRTRYTQRKNMLVRESPTTYSYPRRSHSAERYDTHKEYIEVREAGTPVSRYVRNRTVSPHRNGLVVSQIRNDDNVIRAIQTGLEKRQRAIRLSLYEMPDPVDYEWEI